MAGVTVYDIKQVIITLGPIWIQGFAEGDTVTTEFDEAQEQSKAGADGNVVRTISASKLATATLRLARGSLAAAQLRAMKRLLKPPLDQSAFRIKDIGAGLEHFSLQAWVEGDGPAPSFSADAPVEEWKIKLAQFEVGIPIFAAVG